jgi:hypothetical protein
MPKYSDKNFENQGFSQLFMKQVAMCYDGGKNDVLLVNFLKYSLSNKLPHHHRPVICHFYKINPLAQPRHIQHRLLLR